MKKLFLLVLLPALLFTPAMVFGQNKVRATGKAAIYKNFTQIARDRALDNAKKMAVEQSVRVYIKSETLVRNYELIYDRIYSKYAGYIDSFEIVEDKPVGDEYVVTIEAVVAAANMQEDLDHLLQSLLVEKANPRVIVLFREGTPDAFIAETAMIEYFLSKKFKLLDSGLIKTGLTSGWFGTLESDKEKISYLGQRFGAEIIVVGSVSTSSQPFAVQGVEMYANRAAVSAKVLKSDTGELMASGSREEKLPGIKDMTREPLEKAGRILAQELTEKIAVWWQNELNQSLSVTLIVEGLTSYQEVNEIKERLPEEVRGIQSIQQRLFEQNRLELEIALKGKIDFLAHDLVDFKLNNRSGRIINQSANVLTIKME